MYSLACLACLVISLFVFLRLSVSYNKNEPTSRFKRCVELTPGNKWRSRQDDMTAGRG
jgi:hypothetical protein